jgi:hypothetical protein
LALVLLQITLEPTRARRQGRLPPRRTATGAAILAGSFLTARAWRTLECPQLRLSAAARLAHDADAPGQALPATRSAAADYVS